MNYTEADFTQISLRSKVPDKDIEPMIGKILTDNEYDVLVSGPTSITIPSDAGGRKALLKYLPGAFPSDEMNAYYGTLHALKEYETTNRGAASGTQRHKAFEDSTWTYSKPVASAIIGAFDAAPPKNYCRLTAFTAKEADKFASLFPMFQKVAALFAEHVPDRYRVQAEFADRSSAEWVIPGTPFSTATVNNSYPTGVHTDKGDLDAGFSTLTVLRRGDYRGGRLVFPQWRVAVDMQDGDLLLMDAHQWHGNTALELLDPPCYAWHDDHLPPVRATQRVGVLMGGGDQLQERVRELCEAHMTELRAAAAPSQILWYYPITPAERISTVLYYRTNIEKCADAETEFRRAQDWADKRIAIGASLVEEMAAEAVG